MKETKPSLRVSSGTAKNKKLTTPNIDGFRPVQEIVKQAVFAIVSDKIIGSRCLDLFAGSGNMGIEALSRGAAWCDFVDSHTEAVKVIEQNLFNCGFSEHGEAFFQHAVKFVTQNTEERDLYDLIFMDPFYEDTAQTHLLKSIGTILKPEGLAVIMYGKQLDLPAILDESGLKVVTTRRFGATHFSVLSR